MRANLSWRIATRVLVRVGECRPASSPAAPAARTLPWERWLSAARRPVRIDAQRQRCRLYHTGARPRRVALAMGERLKAARRPRRGEDATGGRGAANDAPACWRGSTTLDGQRRLVGELLHRRGCRVETGRAPLRETLAAAVLRARRLRSGAPLGRSHVRPGTIALEACARALGVAPGAGTPPSPSSAGPPSMSRWRGCGADERGDPPRRGAGLRS